MNLFRKVVKAKKDEVSPELVYRDLLTRSLMPSNFDLTTFRTDLQDLTQQYGSIDRAIDELINMSRNISDSYQMDEGEDLKYISLNALRILLSLAIIEAYAPQIMAKKSDEIYFGSRVGVVRYDLNKLYHSTNPIFKIMIDDLFEHLLESAKEDQEITQYLEDAKNSITIAKN